MTNVTITGHSVKAIGHAEYGENGSDIVCAAVSILAQTAAECLLRDESITVEKMEINPGYVWLMWTGDTEMVKTIRVGFELLAENFPKNVRLQDYPVPINGTSE